MNPSQPTAWLSYVEVASVKATIAKAKTAGAKVVVPYQAIGKMGALGVFIDPQGAALGVWEKAGPARKKPAAKKKR
jgi:predicted enzyme related to lactoylglutathione lyase